MDTLVQAQEFMGNVGAGSGVERCCCKMQAKDAVFLCFLTHTSECLHDASQAPLCWSATVFPLIKIYSHVMIS